MKTKTSLIATAATIALFSAANGQTVIDITGSTAGRSAVIGRVKALLVGETGAWRGNSSETKADYHIYHGGTYNGTAVTVRMSWSGSAAGVRDVSNSVQLNNLYIDPSYTGSGFQAAAPLIGASAQTVSEIGFSDVFQTSTSFQTNTLVDEVSVAVIPFVFMKNDGAAAGITNITPALFQSLFGVSGELPLSYFTGNAADETHTVYATGRNNESGTRITTVADNFYGLNQDLQQYTGTGDPSVLTFVGNGGYSSGGSVATLLSATSAAGTSVVGYLGTSDGGTASTGGAAYLKFDGVDYSAEAVYNGQYSLWGYLHQSAMFNPDTATGITRDFYVGLRDAMIANPGDGTLSETLMKVERGTDGGIITTK